MPPKVKDTTASRIGEGLFWAALLSLPFWMAPALRALGSLCKALGWV